MSFRLQIYAFAAAVTGLAILVAWAGYSAWQELQVLRRNFSMVQTSSFHMAEHIEATLSELSELVLRFESRRAPEVRAAFEKEGQELRNWIEEQKTLVTTSREADLLQEIHRACQGYLEATRGLFHPREDFGAETAGKPLVETLADLSRPVLDLCAELRAAERLALNQFVSQSHQSVATLQGMLGLSVVLVVVLGITATRLIYQAKIAPLRAQVMESRALLERQEKLASLGTLAAGVAHEVRNPLTAINVRVHGLKKALAPGSSEHEDVTVIDEEIRRLDRIVRDFLDFARPSEPRFVTLAIPSLFERVRNLLAPQWTKAGIEFTVEPAPLAWIRADPQQMEQVLINLVQNAADSIEHQGTIILRARLQAARVLGRGFPAVILQVADTGRGIPPEIQKRIFDPFFTTREGGTGLGLAIAAGIVQKHGGVLQFQSQVGRGTTFSLILPRVEENQHESAA